MVHSSAVQGIPDSSGVECSGTKNVSQGKEMNMMFTFKIAAILPLLKHSLKSKKQHSLYGMKGTDKPGLWIVKDAGVYLMSNGDPGMLKDDKSGHVVIYAEGWGPDTHLGGDDWAELIEADWMADILRQADAKGRDTFNVTFTETTMKLSV